MSNTYVHSFDLAVLQYMDTPKHYTTVNMYTFCFSTENYEQTRRPGFCQLYKLFRVTPHTGYIALFQSALTSLETEYGFLSKTKGIVVLSYCVCEPSSHVNNGGSPQNNPLHSSQLLIYTKVLLHGPCGTFVNLRTLQVSDSEFF